MRRNVSGLKRGAVRYPWGRWFEAGHVTIVRGVDFKCQMHGMVQNVRQAADRHGVRVRVQVATDKITITVKGEGEK